MAVDTRNRRASCIGIGLPFARIRPLADGSLADAVDRRQIAFCYAGIAAGAVLATYGTCVVTDSQRYSITLVDSQRYNIILADSARYTVTLTDGFAAELD